MTNEDKNVAREAARWLRVGVLSLSVLGPVINSVVAQLRERAETVRQSRAIAQSQEKLAAVGATLAERGNELSHELVKRGSGLSHELVKRGSGLSHELAERSTELSHELAKRGELVTREVSRRGHDARALAQRNSRWLALAGFGIGAAGSSIVAYLFIRRRILQHTQEAEEQFILPQNGLLNGATHTPHYGNAQTAIAEAAPVLNEPVVLIVMDEAIEDIGESEQATPEDAAFVGIASTRRYYPASVLLDTLQTQDSQTKDMVYFATEDEARAQGFSAA